MNWAKTFTTIFLFLLVMGLVERAGAATAVSPVSPAEDAPFPDVVQPGDAAAAEAPLAGPSFIERVVELVNVERWNNGQLPPLKANAQLQTSAHTHSDNMAVRNFFAHCDLDTGATPWERMHDAGYMYNAAAENIAAYSETPTAVMNEWMNSSGHRANILSPDYREIGVGYVYQAGDQANVRQDANGDCVADGTYDFALYHYWTQNFGRINNVYPVVIEREAYQTSTRQVQLYMYGAGWAAEMRFRNAGGDWSAWQAYSETAVWSLDGGSGLKTVEAQIRNGSTVLSASDTIWLIEVIVDPLFVYLPLVRSE
ncbi:MAG: hypothetical protein KC443_14990 [Anaerolineales bacterium]|nr:hypothetical protein [Anaerolineales bacterium]